MAAHKTDMERIGLFSEMGYATIGDRYPKIDPRSKPFNDAAYKGKQMLPGGSKTRSALQAGYFEGTYKRVMEKEAYSDSIKMRRQDRISQNKKNISKNPFLPSSNTKKRSGLGNTYGTFSGPHKSFAPNTRPKGTYQTPGKNFTTTPGKKGTGYGYVHVTFSKNYDHSFEPYDAAKVNRKKEMKEHSEKLKGGSFKLGMHPKALFDGNIYRSDRIQQKSKSAPTSKTKLVVSTPFRPSNPAKKIAGCKAGTFGDYPKHSADSYIPESKVMAALQSKLYKSVPKSRGIFHPSPGPKSIPTRSVLEQNVVRTMNRNNYKTCKTILAF